MESRFREELEQLKMMILQMAALADSALEKAMRALFERDNGVGKRGDSGRSANQSAGGRY